MKGFADRLREARVAVGLTQEQLGFAVGVTKSSVSAWENGRETPSFHLLPRLRTALQRSLDELVCAAPSGEASSTGAMADENALASGTAARNPEEQVLLLRFRRLPARRRHAVLELIGGGADL